MGKEVKKMISELNYIEDICKEYSEEISKSITQIHQILNSLMKNEK